VTIVQQHDVAGAQAAQQAPQDHGGVTLTGVEAASCPARQTQIQARQHRPQKGVAKSGGGAKELRCTSCDGGQRGLPRLQLVGVAARPEE
jgi:hypothetical protein